MTFDSFIMILLICSIVTSLLTEAIKIILSEHNITYYSNTLVLVVSCVVTLFITVGYIILYDMPLNADVAIYSVALIVMSALCAMLGYDKVIQAIGQIKG